MTANEYILDIRFYRVGVAALAVFWVLAFSQASHSKDAHEGHDHAKDAGIIEQAEENGLEQGEEDMLSMSLEEIAEMRCEHNTETYLCDVCRYEVGVVRVAPWLLKQGETKEGLIRVGKVVLQTISAKIQTTGEISLNANSTVHVTPRISGIINSVAVDIGTQVTEGDVLFSINSTELGKSMADYQRSRTMAALSKQTYEREMKLFNEKVGSEQDMIDAQMAYEQHRTDLIAVEQTLHVFGLSENDVAVAEMSHGTDIGILPVRAPRSGVVLERHAVVGELVEPGSDVMLLADLETLWVWVDIYERDLALINGGKKDRLKPVEITVKSYPNRVFHGAINYVGAVMDEKTRTVKARALVKNTDGLLRPGMFCEVNMSAGASEEALVVPDSAVFEDEGAHFVFKHWKDDYFVQRTVKVGRCVKNTVEILDGVKEGETIATEGAFLLKSDVLREKMGAGCAD
ncbi:MAG: efflux RND transporter periplasmic adaptor subunit [Chlamydiota bacterium]|nr:efflux RND transporter periplasmic adaptor subunit [Chlamydiota bacterium]